MKNNLVTRVVLEWSFSPHDYFEAPIVIKQSGYTLTIDSGKAEAIVDFEVYENNPGIRQILHKELNDRFLGVQLLTHEAYELSESAMTHEYPDGRRNIFIELEDTIKISGGLHADILIRDKDGKIIVDSKQERIESKKNLSELICKYHNADETLKSMLRSHNAAVRDPSNELVHLYEIREALAVKFGSEKNARSAMKISANEWSRLGQLCNSEPLNQGRHRGKTGNVLRDATDAELSEARSIALTMIESYLRYLEIHQH